MKNKNIFKIITLCTAMTSCIYGQTISISKAYDLALQNSHDLKSLNKQLNSKEEGLNIVKSSLYPQINASISASRTDFEINHAQNRLDYGISETSLDYSLSIRQNIYNKEIFTKLDIEKSRIKLFENKIDLKKQDLVKTILKIYIDILKSQNKINLLKSYVKYNTYKLEAIEDKFKLNLSNKMDLLQTKVDLNSSKIDLIKEEKLITLYKSKLSSLISKKAIQIPDIRAYSISNSIIEIMKNFVTNKIDFSSNLNIAQANIQLELLKNELVNAKAGYLPTASLDAKYTKYNSNDITVDYEDTTRIGLQVNIPLYNGGKTQSNILSSKLNIEATREDLIKIQKDIKINYEENLLIFNSSLESIKMYQESMESALLYLDSVSLGFNNGLKSIIDVNEAKNKLYEVEYRYIENLYEMIDAYVNILIVTNKFDGLKLLDKLIVK